MADEQEKKFQKRKPAKNTKISDISKEMDRVAVLGTVLGKEDAILAILVDDGTGKINALLKNEEQYQKIATGNIVRVIGKLWGEGDDIEIQAEIVQEFSDIDVELYNKVFLDQ